MSTFEPLWWLWLFAVTMMAFGWYAQYRQQNATLVDALWAFGLAVAAMEMAVLGQGALWPRLALGLAGGLWGLRLALHLARRAQQDVEDGRYRSMREHWQNVVQPKFFVFFQMQALLVVLFALPFVAVAANWQTHPVWLAAGAVVWLVSVGGEALADRQLAHFRADPAQRGRTCRQGLWRYSRHPNYFFECVHWLAYVAFAAGSPLWWLSWIGPVLMFVSVRWVSGVPWTEMQALRSRGDDYRAYQRETSVLIPWFVKAARLPSDSDSRSTP